MLALLALLAVVFFQFARSSPEIIQAPPPSYFDWFVSFIKGGTGEGPDAGDAERGGTGLFPWFFRGNGEGAGAEGAEASRAKKGQGQSEQGGTGFFSSVFSYFSSGEGGNGEGAGVQDKKASDAPEDQAQNEASGAEEDHGQSEQGRTLLGTWWARGSSWYTGEAKDGGASDAEKPQKETKG